MMERYIKSFLFDSHRNERYIPFAFFLHANGRNQALDAEDARKPHTLKGGDFTLSVFLEA